MSKLGTLLLLACSCGSESAPACPEGYQTLPDLESCYRTSAESTTNWVNSRTACADDGAILAIPDSGYEAIALATLVTNAGFTNGWVGLSDIETEDLWLTVLDAPAEVLPWGNTEPNGGTTENCARIDSNGQLTDEACTAEHAFVCELLP